MASKLATLHPSCTLPKPKLSWQRIFFLSSWIWKWQYSRIGVSGRIRDSSKSAFSWVWTALVDSTSGSTTTSTLRHAKWRGSRSQSNVYLLRQYRHIQKLPKQKDIGKYRQKSMWCLVLLPRYQKYSTGRNFWRQWWSISLPVIRLAAILYFR